MRILVVDDDTRLTQLLQLVFESRGFGVTVANSGQEALESVEKELPEAILLDLMMPGLSGVQVCQRLKTNPRTSNVPVVFLTAKTSPDARQEMMQAGAIDYLIKPIRPSDLIQRIRELTAPSARPGSSVLT
jgi:DNA-binding response OmpR family regulator